MSQSAQTPNFDHIAPLYRWLEYLTLGPVLARARQAHLALLPPCGRALVLGDGDGRFTARLMARQPALRVDAVDLSPAMLRLLTRNVQAAGAQARLTTHHADARSFNPSHACDLVVTHFFLDCLTDQEAHTLITRLAHQRCAPGTHWLVSEFRIPPGLLRWPAWLYIRALYLAFRLLTGLRVSRLPEFREPLHAAGFRQIAVRYGLCGLLVSELWRNDQPMPEAASPIVRSTARPV